jgi:HK97 family phage portal protein
MASFWQRLFKRDKAAALGGESFLPQWGTAPKRGTKELIEAYRKQPWLRAVTHRISGSVASVPWHIYTRSSKAEKGQKLWRPGVDVGVRDLGLTSGDALTRLRRRKELRRTGELREITDHPLLQMICRPSDLMTGSAALGLTQTYLDLKGETFWALQFDASGVPTGYHPLPPHWVTDVPNRTSQVYKLQVNGTHFEVPAAQVVWLRHTDPSNPFGRGSGIAEALGDELETDEYAAKTIKEWFYNRAIPALVVSVQGVATKEQMAQAKETWEQTNRGVGNGSRVHFLHGQTQVTRLDSAWKDQQYVELRRNQRDFVRQVFSVPPEVMGIIENSNRATSQAAFFHYAQGVLVPRLEFLRTEMQHRVVPLFDDRLVVEYESPVPDDSDFQLKIMSVVPEAFQLNEFRALANFEPDPTLEGVYAHHASGAQSNATEAPTAAESPVDDEGKAGDPPWVAQLRTLK